MIRDPVFGGIDWDGVRQLVFVVGSLLLLLSFGAATSGDWYDPYVIAGDYIQAHAPAFIFLAMLLLMGGYLYLQFEQGRL
jgi:hypothetical protein